MGGLTALLLEFGGPILARAIGRKLGADMGDLAGDALDALGRAFGTAPEEPAIEAAMRSLPTEQARARVVVAEADMAAVLLAQAEIMRQGNDQQRLTNELLTSTAREPGWRTDWLPAWQWFLMLLWGWTILIVHILNAAIRLSTRAEADQAVSLPAPDLGTLMTLTGVYLGLHMGGHTVLEMVRNQWGGLFGKKGTPG